MGSNTAHLTLILTSLTVQLGMWSIVEIRKALNLPEDRWWQQSYWNLKWHLFRKGKFTSERLLVN